MDLAKLLSVIEYRALFFARADLLGDPHEGAYGKPFADRFVQSLNGKSKEEYKAIVDRHTAERRKRLTAAGVSSWHLREHESNSMWALYAPRGSGFAIQTTMKRLHDSLQGCGRETWVWAISYVDYEQQEVGTDFPFSSLIGKRLAFEDEREVRAYTMLTDREVANSIIADGMRKKGFLVIREEESGNARATTYLNLGDKFYPEGGVYVPVNVEILIEGIYLAPQTPAFVRQLLQTVLRRHDLAQIPVHRSVLDLPRYDEFTTDY